MSDNQPPIPIPPLIPIPSDNAESTKPQSMKSSLYQRKLAALIGLAALFFAIGFLYIKFSETVSVEYIKFKAAQGDATAQYRLGGRYYNGVGVPKDVTNALGWWAMAARQYNAEAQFAVGIMILEGQGVAKDHNLGMDFIRKAAEQNYGPAQYQLWNDSYLNPNERWKWLCKAAEQNYGPAQCKLGDIYNDGPEWGTYTDQNGNSVKQDYAEAVKWFHKAANTEPFAQYKLGDAYFVGHGVQQDTAEAVKWFRKAAEQHNYVYLGNAQINYNLAQEKLGDIYYYGKGVKQNYVEALKWYRILADTPNERACRIVGEIYASGKGVKKDSAEAAKWYAKAAGLKQ